MEEMEMDFTQRELMAVAGARELADGEVVVAGIGLPQVSTQLAKMTHAPRITQVMEIGVVDPSPIHPSVGIADPRAWLGARYFGSFTDVLGTILHRGLVDVGFLSGLEVDQYGNLNTTLVRTAHGDRHINGSGGGNDIASLAKRTIIIMRHEKRKLSEKVAYVTTPGFLQGGRSREEAGLRGAGPSRVITDKAVLGFDDSTRKMKLVSIHPGVSLDELINCTGFSLIIPERVETTPSPTPEQLRYIREVIDSHRWYTGDEV
jgi:acyl CoA:acetate/3-ketoacid CoA transferase beta subunit